MDSYYAGQVPLAVDGDEQHPQSGTITSAPPGESAMLGLDANPLDDAMFAQGSQTPSDASRRHSLPQPTSPYLAHVPQQVSLSMSNTAIRSLGADAGLPLMDFTTAGMANIASVGDANSGMENAFRNFSFGATELSGGFPISTVPAPSMPLTLATPGYDPSAAASQSASGFSSAPGVLTPEGQRGGPFSMLPHGFIDDVISYPGLDMSQLAVAQAGNLDTASIGFFPTAGPDMATISAPVSAISGGLESPFSASPVDALSARSFVSPMEIDMDASVPMLGDPVSTVNPLSMRISPTALPRQQRATQAPLSLFANASQALPPAATSASELGVSMTSVPPQQQPQFPTGFRPSIASTPSLDDPSIPPPRRSTSSSVVPTISSAPHPGSAAASTPAVSAPAQASSATPALSQRSASATAPAHLLGAQAPIGPSPIKNYYSSSGFDMIRALYYVSSRPNPEIRIGPVDLSCAFVVCDATQDDYPIIYMSDNFQHLTGYSRHEILGQNCRFLQAPDGKVEAGSRREFTDNRAVMNIKEKLLTGREVQQSLINYRKGGKPFLNLLTMIPIPWDDYKDGYKYFIGLQIDLVESPEAISGQSADSMRIDYKHRTSIPQYIWDPPKAGQWKANHGRTLGMDDVSALLQQFGNSGLMGGALGVGADIVGTAASDLYRQSWDKMLLENVDDVIHVLSLKGVFLYISPSCKTVLEYDSADLLGNSLSAICHPSDIVPVTREMRDTPAGQPINFAFRIRRKRSGYTWFESHGSLLVEQGKGRKCIVLVGRRRPAYALRRSDVDINGGIGDSEIWTKLSTSGMILHASSNVRSLLDLQPDSLAGSSMQDLMRKESRAGFHRSLEKVRRGIIASCRHEVQHRRGQVLQACTILYPGDAERGEKPTFILGQTRLLKLSSSRHSHGSAAGAASSVSGTSGWVGFDIDEIGRAGAVGQLADLDTQTGGFLSSAGGGAVPLCSNDAILAADDNIFDELKTTRCTSWQYELRQMEKANRLLAEELGQLLANRKKRKRRKGVGNVPRDCANCHRRDTPEWRRGPSGQRDLCNSCGLRWAKQVGRVSPRNSSRGAGSTTMVGAPGANSAGDTLSKKSTSPTNAAFSQRETADSISAVAATMAGTRAASGQPDSGSSSGNNSTTLTGDNGNSGTDQLVPQLPPLTGTEMAIIQEEREMGL